MRSPTSRRAATGTGTAAVGSNGTLPTVIDGSGITVAFGTPTAINFTAGVASVSSSKNGVMKLSRAEATTVSISDGTISTSTPLALTVKPGTPTRLAFSNPVLSGGIFGSPCLFTCAVTSLGNSGTIVAKVNVTDSLGNTASAIGSNHAVKVTSSGGTISAGTLTISSTGPAESTSQFTYTAKSSGTYTDTITAATSAGTTYTSATLTANK